MSACRATPTDDSYRNKSLFFGGYETRRSVLSSIALLFILLPLCANACGAAAFAGTAVGSSLARAGRAPLRLDRTSARSVYRQFHEEAVGRSWVRPYDTVSGSCGDSFIYVYSQGYGEAGFSYGVDSSLGPVSYLSGRVSWKNERTGASNSFPVSANPNSEQWSKYVIYYTDWGTVSATFSGYVILTDGTECTILNPTASGFVSPSSSPAS